MLWLLCDRAAGYAVTGVAGGIGFIVIGLGVDDDGGAAVAEEGVRAIAEGYIAEREPQMRFALGVDSDVFHITRVMAFGILKPMLLALEIEMRPRGLEVRGIALCVLVKVDAVLPGRKIVEIHFDAYDVVLLLPENDPADGLALSILEFDTGFGGAGKRGDG